MLTIPSESRRPPCTARVTLVLQTAYSAATSPWGVRAWRWQIVADGIRVGTISLRDGHSQVFTHLLGHIGFAVDAAYRGRGYAGLAVQALLPEIARLALGPVWITTTPDNAACRRTLERLGCVFVEEVAVPPSYPTYARGERSKLRFRLQAADAIQVMRA